MAALLGARRVTFVALARDFAMVGYWPSRVFRLDSSEVLLSSAVRFIIACAEAPATARAAVRRVLDCIIIVRSEMGTVGTKTTQGTELVDKGEEGRGGVQYLMLAELHSLTYAILRQMKHHRRTTHWPRSCLSLHAALENTALGGTQATQSVAH